MANMKAWMLGAAMLVGGLGAGAMQAQAAEFGVYIGGPVAYVPPCPGPGYYWTAGYYSDGYWVPGRWAFRGYIDGYRYRSYDGDDYRYYDRDDRHWGHHRGWDHDRGWERHGDRDWDRGGDRHWDHDR